jgi:hypothetical protein
MHELVLDTNVLVTALRSRRGASHQLIRLIGTDVFRINLSVALALEYEEVLKRVDLVPGMTEADIDKFLDYIFSRQTSCLRSGQCAQVCRIRTMSWSSWERLQQRAARGSRDAFVGVLDKVPDIEPEEYDRS